MLGHLSIHGARMRTAAAAGHLCSAEQRRRSSSSCASAGPPHMNSQAPAAVSEHERTTQLGEFVSRQISNNVVDFAAGQPGPALLPCTAIAAAAAHRFSGPSANPLLLQYNPDTGYRSFRAALASFLSSETAHSVSEDELLITAGVSHGLDLACRQLAAPGDEVLVEAPTYFLAGRILQQAGLKPVPVPMSERGIDVSALAKLLCAPGAPRPTLAYLVPVHHNPCGVTLSTPDRETLLALAHEHGFTVLADEVYQLLSFPGAPPPPPPLRAVEQRMLQCGRLLPAAPSGCMQASSRVVSLGSFSKILAPGTRLGWMEADTVTLRRVRRDGVLCSGGGVAPLASGIVHSCIELGLLQHHLHDVVIPALSERCAALCDELRQRLPDVRFVQPFGGYFVWLQLPQHVCAEELQQFAAAQHGVLFVAGSACGGERNTLRLSFAFYPPEELREGVRRLAAALEDYIGQKTS